ncbi:hypothetical protein ACA910_002077 [Epithemia clementina (nom. ined.)]
MPCNVLVVSKAEDIPTKCIDGKPTLVYWNILGLSQSCRLALIAANVEFVDVRIEAGSDIHSPEFKKAWMDKKHNCAELIQTLTFPNLPYLLHPDFPANKGLVQSDSILRYIGGKYGLQGPQPAFTDMYLEHLHDMELSITRHAYGSGGDAVLQFYQTEVPGMLKDFGRLFLSPQQHHKFLSSIDGDDQGKPCVADWKLYVLLYKLKVVQSQLGNEATATILGDHGEWVRPYMERMEAIPAIQAYMACESYMKGSLNNPHAKWRG